MEYIKRKIKSEKITVEDRVHKDCQISINSFGHLTIRFFKPSDPEEDEIIVFDAGVTNAIIRYIRKMLKISDFLKGEPYANY